VPNNLQIVNKLTANKPLASLKVIHIYIVTSSKHHHMKFAIHWVNNGFWHHRHVKKDFHPMSLQRVYSGSSKGTMTGFIGATPLVDHKLIRTIINGVLQIQKTSGSLGEKRICSHSETKCFIIAIQTGATVGASYFNDLLRESPNTSLFCGTLQDT